MHKVTSIRVQRRSMAQQYKKRPLKHSSGCAHKAWLCNIPAHLKHRNNTQNEKGICLFRFQTTLTASAKQTYTWTSIDSRDQWHWESDFLILTLFDTKFCILNTEANTIHYKEQGWNSMSTRCMFLFCPPSPAFPVRSFSFIMVFPNMMVFATAAPRALHFPEDVLIQLVGILSAVINMSIKNTPNSCHIRKQQRSVTINGSTVKWGRHQCHPRVLPNLSQACRQNHTSSVLRCSSGCDLVCICVSTSVFQLTTNVTCRQNCSCSVLKVAVLVAVMSTPMLVMNRAE